MSLFRPKRIAVSLSLSHFRTHFVDLHSEVIILKTHTNALEESPLKSRSGSDSRRVQMAFPGSCQAEKIKRPLFAC